MMISVCLASYNGESYIREQLESLISQTVFIDEIIIVDDGSTDSTIAIINNMIIKYNNIKLFVNDSNLGVIKTFEKAITLACGEYIFLCDQDDIWLRNKVETCMKHFQDREISCLVSDAYIFNGRDIYLETFFQIRRSSGGLIRNALHNSFIGCCMAFRRSVKDLILPFPPSITMHDQWIGMASHKIGKVKFLTDRLILYRRHDKNVTDLRSYNLKRIFKNRLRVMIMLLHLAKLKGMRG